MRSALSLSLLLALTVTAAGCASTMPAADPVAGLAPRPTPPAVWSAPRPPAASAPVAPVSTPVADPHAWWRGFDEPLLAELLRDAEASQPTLDAARARLDRARAALSSAEATGQPRVDAGATLGASGGRVDGQPQPPRTTTLTAGLQASWELDLFGAQRAGATAARERVAASVADWHAARTALAAEIGSAVVALRACEAQALQAQLDAQSRSATASLTERSAAAGLAAPADAALARAGAASARNAARGQQAQCDSLVKALVELTGVTEPALRQRLAARAGRVPRRTDAGTALPELPAALLAQRPDVIAAERSVLAAAAEQAGSRAREWPQIVLAGSLNATSSRSAGVSADGSSWSLGPLSVNFPLWDGGARRAATAAARAGYDEAVAEYQGTVRRAFREVESALVALDAAGARQADAQAAARDFEASLRATEARWRGGLASLFELEDARRSALAAQNVLIDLDRERATAWVTLWRALGGGFGPDAGSPPGAWATARALPAAPRL
jgi:NodT family efflux transporter outer membrane factor (OMF) lipoprotein